MNVLTDNEKGLLVLEHLGPKALAHDTMSLLEAFELGLNVAEQEVIRKLAAGVSVEPYATLHHDDGYFTTKQREHDLRYSGPMRTEVVTLDQLTTAIAATRVQENERCVQACAAKSKEYLARSNRDQHSHGAGLGAAICAELLSALLGKEAQS